ncbi:MAG: hypothetical protein ACYCXW_12250, partial [Solirubrobacteraceae bacterium]
MPVVIDGDVHPCGAPGVGHASDPLNLSHPLSAGLDRADRAWSATSVAVCELEQNAGLVESPGISSASIVPLL